MKVAAVQLCSTQDVDQNLETTERYVREAASQGAELIVTPENTPFLRTEADAAAPIQGLDGPIITRLAALAGQCGVFLLVGSFQEAVDGEDTRYANTSVLLDGRNGHAQIIALYRKLHLFDIDIKDGESQKESDLIVQGEDVVCTQLGEIPLGMSICYDLRFPLLYQRLVDLGARVITVPSAFTEYTGKDHWLTLLQARAIETQCFVIAPNQYGFHGGRRRSYGKSVIIDPWGIPLAIAPDKPGWIMATLDFEHQAIIRDSLPCLKHRHPRV